MKEVIYRDEIRVRLHWLPLAERGTKALEDILGGEAATVTAEWEYAPGVHGEDLFTLTLSDWAGSQTGVLKPEELESVTQLPLRLLRLWGAVLQTRNHKMLADLLNPREASEDPAYAR
jgi:hypothetical protein